MTKFKDGDRVKIVNAPEHGKHHIGKIGIAKTPGGHGYENDDVNVWVDGGEIGYFKEHQLERAD